MTQNTLPTNGLLRLSTILEIIPVSRSSWWAGVRNKSYPQPVRLGKRMTAWRASDIARLIEEGVRK
jgi:prophage regulatory protein